MCADRKSTLHLITADRGGRCDKDGEGQPDTCMCASQHESAHKSRREIHELQNPAGRGQHGFEGQTNNSQQRFKRSKKNTEVQLKQQVGRREGEERRL